MDWSKAVGHVSYLFAIFSPKTGRDLTAWLYRQKWPALLSGGNRILTPTLVGEMPQTTSRALLAKQDCISEQITQINKRKKTS